MKKQNLNIYFRKRSWKQQVSSEKHTNLEPRDWKNTWTCRALGSRLGSRVGARRLELNSQLPLQPLAFFLSLFSVRNLSLPCRLWNNPGTSLLQSIIEVSWCIICEVVHFTSINTGEICHFCAKFTGFGEIVHSITWLSQRITRTTIKVCLSLYSVNVLGHNIARESLKIYLSI